MARGKGRRKKSGGSAKSRQPLPPDPAPALAASPFTTRLTREALGAMREDQLQADVLIPLFKAMGFRDVFRTHGSGEQGQDIVMWRPDDVRGRINFAAVVKATKITGRADGRGSAANVFFQIRQAFGHEYQDPTTLAPLRIHRCLVLTNQAILPQSLESLKNALDHSALLHAIDFFDGDRLWEHVRRLLPHRVLLDNLLSAHETLRGASEYYELTAKTGGDAIELAVRPKQPDAARIAPAGFNVKLDFPPTDEGKAALEAFKRHVATGAPVMVHKEFISAFELSPALQELLEPIVGDAPDSLELGARQIPGDIPATVEVEGNNGERAVLGGLVFRVTAVGTEQATFDNAHQEAPWCFTIILNVPDQSMTLRLEVNYEGANVRQELDGLLLQRALASGGTFTLRRMDTGLPIAAAMVPQGAWSPPPPPLVALLERLVFIQEKTGIPLRVSASISERQVEAVYYAAERIATGVAHGTTQDTRMEFKRDGLRILLEEIEDGEDADKGQFMWRQSETVMIFGTPVPLGESITVIRGLYLEPAEAARLRAAMDENPEATEFSGVLSSPPNNKIVRRYLKWLPGPEGDELRREIAVADSKLASGKSNTNGESTENPEAKQGDGAP